MWVCTWGFFSSLREPPSPSSFVTLPSSLFSVREVTLLLNTPQDVGPCFHRNLILCRPILEQNQTGLPDPNLKPTPAWLGGWVRWRRAITKKHAFCAFFHVQPKHQNGYIFVDIEGFRPCLSKPSYRAPKWDLMVRLLQKERLKSPQKSLIIENQAFGVIFGILAKTPFFGHFGQPFPSQGGHCRWTRRQKAPLGVLLKST